MFLRKLDRVLAPVTWLAAAFVVLTLLVGPELIGAKKSGAQAKPYAPARGGGAADGRQVFAANCAGCHTLAAAGASGVSGPNLDQAKPGAGTVEAKVRAGGGTMPSFEGRLSDAEIKAVADYVAASAGG